MSRRQLFGSSALASLGALSAAGLADPAPASAAPPAAVPFFGRHQAGIATPPPDHLAFATFDLAPEATRADLRAVLASWTAAAAAMTQGRALPGPKDPGAPPVDAGDDAGLGSARLTVTLGVGPAFFCDQLDTAAGRPQALVELPIFDSDQLDPQRSGGAIVVQACADNAQSPFAAVRELARLGLGVVGLRALQNGYAKNPTPADPRTARDLLGFHRGTSNIGWSDVAALDRHVWVASADPPWMRGGTYLVARRIRIALESWSAVSLAEQEAAVGRFRDSGAPLSGGGLHSAVDLKATGAHGELKVPSGAHIRIASPAANAGNRILRRGYTFSDGVDPVSGELDAGTFFIAFQRDPDRQFGDMLRRLLASDLLHRYLVHSSSGVYAVPRGLERGEDWGRLLLG